MSLINQMLKDLEERRPAGAARDGVLQDVAAPRQPVANRRKRTGWLPWLMVGVLGVGVGALLWERGTRETPATDTGTAIASVDEAAITPATDTPSPAPVVAEENPVATTTETTAAAPLPDNTAPAADSTVAAAAPTTLQGSTAEATPVPATAAIPVEATPAAAPTTTDAPAAVDAPATPADKPAAPVTREPAAVAKTTDTPAPSPAPVAVAPKPANTAALAARPSPPQVVAKTAHPLTPAQQAEVLYQDGAKQLRLGRLARAEDLLREALATAPQHAQARHALAGLLVNGGRSDEALSLLSQGLALDARQSKLAALHGRLLLERGAAGEARGVLETAAPPLASDPDYHALLAAVYQRVGAHDAAARTYQSLLQLRSGQGAWWIGLAISAEALGDSASAAQAYRQALATGALAPDLQTYAQSKLSALSGASP